jgi:hypothetical protein
MNATSWDDHLERNLVCGSNGPFPGYEFVCIYHTQVTPVWQLGIGVWSHYLARLQLRLPDRASRSRHSMRGANRGGGNSPANKSGSSSTSTKRGVANDTRKLSRRHGSWVLTVFGTMGLLASGAHFFGLGCVYDMDDIRGQIGDAFSKLKKYIYTI